MVVGRTTGKNRLEEKCTVNNIPTSVDVVVNTPKRLPLPTLLLRPLPRKGTRCRVEGGGGGGGGIAVGATGITRRTAILVVTAAFCCLGGRGEDEEEGRTGDDKRIPGSRFKKSVASF